MAKIQSIFSFFLNGQKRELKLSVDTTWTMLCNIYLPKCRVDLNSNSLFVCNRGDTTITVVSDHLLLVFLTPRKALSSHSRQQMVWLYWLQDRDSMLNWFAINHPTTLHTQWNPVTHCCSPMSLCAGKVDISQHLALRFPPEWPYCRQAQCRCWFTV